MLAFTIAAEIGEIERFASPEKLTGYSGLCPRVNQGEIGATGFEPATARPPAECAYPRIETPPGAAHACPYV